jgi:hypothetical protein
LNNLGRRSDTSSALKAPRKSVLGRVANGPSLASVSDMFALYADPDPVKNLSADLDPARSKFLFLGPNKQAAGSGPNP